MKRILLTIAVALLTIVSLFAKDVIKNEDRHHNKWLIMAGYGYAHTSDINASGLGCTSSVIFLPHKLWGFGLDLGMNQTYGVSRYWDLPESYMERYNIYSDCFIGPSVHLFPINSKYHRVHLGAGGNIFNYNENHISKEGYGQSYIEDGEIYISNGKEGMCNIGFHASAGYSVKFLKHLELGVRAYTSFYQEGFNLNALLNLSVSF